MNKTATIFDHETVCGRLKSNLCIEICLVWSKEYFLCKECL